jgi:glycosyltransferase involved in cell wall biosynthesis
MYSGYTVALLLPARNEELCLPPVLRDIPPEVDAVLVIDNGSTDSTVQTVQQFGIPVISEPVSGYGRACLAGIAALKNDPPDIVAFSDADGSDDLSALLKLIAPIAEDHADLVIEMRMPIDPDALTQQQRFGNWLATRLIRLFWGHAFQDLGPMRAIRWGSLQDLHMKDQDFGWTIEMQIKAVQRGLRIIEVPLPYMKRSAGDSKISRTVKGTIRAGIKIIWVIFREAFIRKLPAKKNSEEGLSNLGGNHLPSK